MRPWLPFLILLCCACERRPRAWVADLAAADPFDRFLAAVALVERDGQVPARAVSELIRVTQGPDLELRATAIRVLGKYPDQAVRTFFTLLDRRAQPGQVAVKWTGSDFERALFDRLSPALKHPQCAEHARYCAFIASLPEWKLRVLGRLNLERRRAPAGE